MPKFKIPKSTFLVDGRFWEAGNVFVFPGVDRFLVTNYEFPQFSGGVLDVGRAGTCFRITHLVPARVWGQSSGDRDAPHPSDGTAPHLQCHGQHPQVCDIFSVCG